MQSQTRKPKIKINRRQQAAQYFLEQLNDQVSMEMMLIPGGEFLMGAPEDELDSGDSKRPQHKVSVPTFFMGKYPVTQAQWRAVVAMPQVNRELKPDLSCFKGDKRPVERIKWHDAVEFCKRLSQHSGRKYRLPSEAEWEYACRAGTTTPFHFGETITTDLANYRGTDNEEYEEYNWSGSYGEGPKGEYRKETTPVDKFGIANDFGLCDMHGNVWEWCEDDWHKNYQNAPSDGSAWVSGGDSDLHVIRGGSWNSYPNNCCSAARNGYNPEFGNYNNGFRVVCMVPRT
ncbi:MAG: formylglycine-generating enzyme family protein [Xenococcus sp. MO_188.B8]|nr:formylglycine-generating enzyme family protein [Xenococcus sp. MO_188.B8]